MIDNRSMFVLTGTNRLVALAILLLTAAAVPLVTYSLLNHPPEYDELLHVLAARGIAETGKPVIEDGVYSRAELYTRLIAYTRGLHHNELVAARLPAITFTVMLVGLVGYWLSRGVGWLAGLTGGWLLAIAPLTLNLAVIVRFYTLHALLVTLLVILVYEASRWVTNLRVLLPAAISATLLIWFAFALHEITIISLGGLCAGIAFLMAWQLRPYWKPIFSRRPMISALACFALTITVLYLAWTLGVIDLLRQSRPVWAEGRANYFGFYTASLGTQMPFFWPLFPIMAIFALSQHTRLSGFLLSIVIVAFIANSIAVQKATRYIFHIFPLACIIWAIGFQSIVCIVSRMLARGKSLSQSTFAVLILALFFSCLISTLEFRRALKLVLGRTLVNDVVHISREPDWVAIRPVIDPLLPGIDKIIASSGFKSLHAFGRYSYELHATVVAETDTGQEFGTDPRTGRQVISTADSVKKVIDKPGTELVVMDRGMLYKPYGANPATMIVINDRCSPIDIPESTGVAAWKC